MRKPLYQARELLDMIKIEHWFFGEVPKYVPSN